MKIFMPKHIPQESIYLMCFHKWSLILLHWAKYVLFSFNDIKLEPSHLSCRISHHSFLEWMKNNYSGDHSVYAVECSIFMSSASFIRLPWVFNLLHHTAWWGWEMLWLIFSCVPTHVLFCYYIPPKRLLLKLQRKLLLFHKRTTVFLLICLKFTHCHMDHSPGDLDVVLTNLCANSVTQQAGICSRSM